MRSLAADLLGVHPGGLVPVVAVGDQQLRAAGCRLHSRDRRSVRDPPQPVDSAIVIGGLTPRLAGGVWLERSPGGLARVREQREDGGQVRFGGAREPQPILAWSGVRALVRSDPSGSVLFDADPR